MATATGGRHHLGITSFGVTTSTAHEAGDPIIAEHDKDSEPSEQLFLVVSGPRSSTSRASGSRCSRERSSSRSLA